MITAILAGTLALGLSQQQLDTTFAVRAGGELRLEALNGAVSIGTWDRPAMRVRASHSSATRIDLEHRDSRVSIEPEHRGRPGPVTFEITVPRSYNVRVDGVNLPITLADLQGSARLENVQGPIAVRGLTGSVDIESVSGSVTVENVRGELSVSTVNQAIRITGGSGNIEAETVNGSIMLRGVGATIVEASTVNGLVDYDGAVHDGGRYFLGTHNGRITMAIPERASARVSIQTQNGRVESAFSVRVSGAQDGGYEFTFGSGSARIELESYNGSIHLVRPRTR